VTRGSPPTSAEIYRARACSLRFSHGTTAAKGGHAMGTLGRSIVLFSTAALWLAAAPRGFADEASDLAQLKADVAAERQGLASEREARAEQRRRSDEALVNLQDQKAELARTGASSAAPLAPVGAPAGESRADGPHLDVYGFIHTDAIYDFDRVDPAWNAT